MLKTDSSLTAKKIGINIDKSERTIQRILKSLKDKKIIERIGETKGFWKINN